MNKRQVGVVSRPWHGIEKVLLHEGPSILFKPMNGQLAYQPVKAEHDLPNVW